MEKKMLAVFVMLAMASVSFGSVVFTFTPSSPTVQPGQSFNLDVNLVTDEPVIGMSYKIQVNAAGAGKFQFTARDLSGVDSLWDPTRTNAQLVFPQTLNPTSINGDLGLTDGLENPHTGTIFLGTLTIKALATAPIGIYTFSTLANTGGDPNYEDIAGTPASASIQVVPEPFSIALLSLGGLGLLRRRS